MTYTVSGAQRAGRGRPRFAAIFWVFLLVVLVCCGPNWEATVVAPDDTDYPVNSTLLDSLAEFVEDNRGVPVERVLVKAGHRAIERVTVMDAGGERRDLE